MTPRDKSSSSSSSSDSDRAASAGVPAPPSTQEQATIIVQAARIETLESEVRAWKLACENAEKRAAAGVPARRDTDKYEHRSPDGDGQEKGTVVHRETSAPEIPSAGMNAGTGLEGGQGKPDTAEPSLPATSDVSPVVEALGPVAGSEPADARTSVIPIDRDSLATNPFDYLTNPPAAGAEADALREPKKT